jgi:clathrin heavy chain
MLYACYDLIPLHTVMELSWRHGLTDFTMPFMINYMAQQAATLEVLKKDNEERKAREAANKTEDDTGPILGGSRLMLTQGPMQTGSPAPGQFGGMNGMMPQPTGYGGFR